MELASDVDFVDVLRELGASVRGSGCTQGRYSAVVVTYNAARFIHAALQSIRGQSYPPAAIIVVDNASADNTLDIITSDFPEVRLIRLPENRGFGRANNIGIERALLDGADFVMLVNQDAVLDPSAAEALVRSASRRNTHGLLGAFQLTLDGKAADAAFPVPDEFWDDLRRGTVRQVYDTRFVPAVAVMIRGAALVEIGGFDPLFFMYHEDQDLCRRLWSAGWQVAVAPAALVRHWNGSTHAKRTWKWERNWALSDAILHLKGSPRPFPIAYVTLLKTWFRTRRFSAVALFACAAAFGRCIVMAPTIWRHRNRVPVRFTFAKSAANSPASSADCQ